MRRGSWETPSHKRSKPVAVFANSNVNVAEKRIVGVEVREFLRRWECLIFHRLVEQRCCSYLLGLAMRHTFLLLFFFFFNFDWVDACDEISYQNTIFRDWMALQKPCWYSAILRLLRFKIIPFFFIFQYEFSSIYQIL